jgi:hypothetical protein
MIHKDDRQLMQLQGGVELRNAILAEFEFGVDNLHKDFAPLLQRNSKESLLNKPLKAQISWFKMVRTAREAISNFRMMMAFQKMGL